ncbi:unnamed protein product [Linum trigynum]|uniref:Uncharacterized protein n=1 Tax=Linum trigynum TaxID=586398 RepID=A0AAV2FN51_9ROSI
MRGALSSFGARCWGVGSFDSPPSSLKLAGGINRPTFGARIRRRMKPRQRDGRLLRFMEAATLSRTTRRRRDFRGYTGAGHGGVA